MRNGRTIFWLFAAILAVAAVHLFLYFGGRQSEAAIARTSLVESAEEAAAIAIVRGGTVISLVCDGGAWRLKSPYSAATDEREMRKLVDMLALAEPGEVMTDAELHRLGRSRADFGLEKPRVSVEVSSPGGGKVKIAFGAKTPDGGGAYAAVEGQSWVCIVDADVLAAVDRPAEDFRLRDVFPRGPEYAVSFDVKRGDGQLMRFVRENDEWKMLQPREARASSEKVSRLLAAAMNSKAVSFAWPTGAEGEALTPDAALLAGYGLDSESAVTLSVRCSDGTDAQVPFGKEAPGGLVYALAQSSGAIVAVPPEAKEIASSPPESFIETRLFPMDPAKISRISVEEKGVRYLLGKDAAGAWHLDSPVAAPTDPATVDAFIKNICSLTLDDMSDDGIEVSVSTSSVPVKVSAQSLLDAVRLDDLRSREIFSADPRSVRRIAVSGVAEEKQVSVVYDRDRRAWNVESSPVPGAVADPARIESLLAALNPLRADGIVRLKVSASDLKAFGLDSPRTIVAIDVDGGSRRNILIGDTTDGGAFATLGASGAVFILPSLAESVLEAPLTASGDISKGDK